MHYFFRSNSTLPTCISYIISYYSQASQSYIGIIKHGINWFWLHGSADRQPALRSGKNRFIFISTKQILWQVLCHGHLILLLSTWKMENNFFNPDSVSWNYWKLFLGVRSCYCNKMPILWVYVDILKNIFSAFMGVDNLSQKSGCPNFYDSIRNISTKTHGF